MSERFTGAERQPRIGADLEHLAAERRRSLERGEHEQASKPEASVEAAREKIRQVEQVRPAAEAAPREEGHQPVLTRSANYRQTMVSLQHRMKPTARAFSRFIHRPAVDKASEIVGKTVMRPSVTLGATSTALFATLSLYIYARWEGIQLRGSEVWLALLIGAIVGLLGEGLGRLVRRPKP